MARFSFKKNVNVKRVVTKVAVVVLSLYVGGTILTEIGNVMNGTASPFYKGLTLIGWTVGDYPMWNATNYALDCARTAAGGTTAPGETTCITAVNGSGILAVVGIVGIASIVMEFVDFSF